MSRGAGVEVKGCCGTSCVCEPCSSDERIIIERYVNCVRAIK